MRVSASIAATRRGSADAVCAIVGSANAIPPAAPAATTPIRALTRESTDLVGEGMATSTCSVPGSSRWVRLRYRPHAEIPGAAEDLSFRTRNPTILRPPDGDADANLPRSRER